MKTIIFFFTLLFASAMISGHKHSSQNKKGEIFDNQESLKNDKTPEGRPKILFMLHNETGLDAWSPAIWWSDQHTNPARPGC